jgi:hypothetical protein
LANNPILTSRFFCFLRPSFLPFFPSDRNLKPHSFQNLLTSSFKSEDFLSIIVYGCASTIGRPHRPLPSPLDKKQRSELVKNSSYTSGTLEWHFAFKALIKDTTTKGSHLTRGKASFLTDQVRQRPSS